MGGRLHLHGFIIAIWTATLVIAAGLWAAALTLARYDDAEAMARAERDSGNLARVVAEQATRTIAEADHVLLFLIDDFHEHGDTWTPGITQLLRQAVERSGILVQLAVVDAHGDLIHTSVEDAPARIHLADREHFRIHVNNPPAGLFIGKPVFGRASGKWSIQLTRRVSNSDGSLAGVLVASMDPFYFSRLLEELDVGPNGAVAIIGTDGILRAHSLMNDRIVGRDLGESPTLQLARRQTTGFVHTASVIDGIQRLQSFRTLASYPLIVTAAFDEDSFLADTRKRQRVYLLAAAACSFGLSGLALLATRQTARLAALARQLVQSEERFRDQAETASDWFWEMDADLRFSNLAGPLVPHVANGTLPIGLRREDVALREPGDAAKWERHRQMMERREPFRNFRYRVMTAAGLRYFSVSGRPIFDEKGRFRGYRGSATDITERELAANRLASSEARYRAMFEAVGQPIITIDEHGTVDAFNRAAERLFGYRAADVVGGPMTRLMPSAVGAVHDGLLATYRESDASVPRSEMRELTGRRKDGSEFPLEATLAGWREGDRRYVTGALRDVTAQREIEASLRRAKEAADQANRAKGEFLATMSHEIRTPMNGVLGALALVEGPNLNEEQRQLLDVANRSGNALLQIIDDILDLSKLEAGKAEVEPVDFELRAVLGDSIDLLEPAACGRGLILTREVAPAVPERVRADLRRIRQVLVNLVGNALKFTHRGGVAVRVGLEETGAGAAAAGGTADGGFFLRFEVADTGIGIPEDVQPTLFRRFTQADSSTTRRFGGTGLGLAISRELVTLMGGRIGVASAEGKGSTFWFTVRCEPAADPSDGVLAVPCAPEPVPMTGDGAAPKAGLHVLVAEDNEINREIVVTMLSRAGHRVTAVEDGLQAVRLVEEGGFDLVLMDVQMPVMDGVTATRHIRGMPGEASRLPIVALTGNVMPGHRAEYLAAGMTDYLTKPIVSADLFDVLASVAESRTAGGTGGNGGMPPRPAAAPVPPAVPSAEPFHAPISHAPAQPPAQPETELWRAVPLLDGGQAESLRAVIGEEAWMRTVAAFRRTVGDSVAAIRNAAGQEAEEAALPLVRIAHTLKGTAANIGAVRLSRLASQLEQRAQNHGGWAVDDPCCEALNDVAEATLEVLSSQFQPDGKTAMEQETA
ncbi:PAS domain S-box-containing protein [Azospirillum lipoferum]|uniref:Sensory/regulatory protein RpfC n=1 Tax=Azospirillum lipoferum TaxID=193 RepID=A0A5A9GRY2_AZOLI|nr:MULTISPECIES: PAS domain S-box protein [Azospirillum]KAA0596545.1 PAS domain S-box protein [Azospirillum lipoferum]MCP1610548.1 PAS domain S-box-containing protein [Azospirillum lipoferum]MDW5538009.1 PAS domain S-box protein [Azospirillum sp. NL1]